MAGEKGPLVDFLSANSMLPSLLTTKTALCYHQTSNARQRTTQQKRKHAQSQNQDHFSSLVSGYLSSVSSCDFGFSCSRLTRSTSFLILQYKNAEASTASSRESSRKTYNLESSSKNSLDWMFKEYFTSYSHSHEVLSKLSLLHIPLYSTSSEAVDSCWPRQLSALRKRSFLKKAFWMLQSFTLLSSNMKICQFYHYRPSTLYFLKVIWFYCRGNGFFVSRFISRKENWNFYCTIAYLPFISIFSTRRYCRCNLPSRTQLPSIVRYLRQLRVEMFWKRSFQRQYSRIISSSMRLKQIIMQFSLIRSFFAQSMCGIFYIPSQLKLALLIAKMPMDVSASSLLLLTSKSLKQLLPTRASCLQVLSFWMRTKFKCVMKYSSSLLIFTRVTGQTEYWYSSCQELSRNEAEQNRPRYLTKTWSPRQQISPKNFPEAARALSLQQVFTIINCWLRGLSLSWRMEPSLVSSQTLSRQSKEALMIFSFCSINFFLSEFRLLRRYYARMVSCSCGVTKLQMRGSVWDTILRCTTRAKVSGSAMKKDSFCGMVISCEKQRFSSERQRDSRDSSSKLFMAISMIIICIETIAIEDVPFSTYSCVFGRGTTIIALLQKAKDSYDNVAVERKLFATHHTLIESKAVLLSIQNGFPCRERSAQKGEKNVCFWIY